MLNAILEISPEKITTQDGKEVMHEWEHPIMEKMAEWVCQNGGDIIEFGFGMGISATYIQQHNINSHTICEINPQILENLHEWAKDKPNVIILEGDWYSNIDKMGKYDGLLFDTHNDLNWGKLYDLLPQICNLGCHVTHWNNDSIPRTCILRGPARKQTEYELIEVDPPQNTYFNHKQFYMPKYIYNHV